MIKNIIFIILVINSILLVNSTDIKPRQLNLALTSNSNELLINWITNDAITQPVVYYFLGDCMWDDSSAIDIADNEDTNNNKDTDSKENSNNSNNSKSQKKQIKIQKKQKEIRVSLGTTKTYYPFTGFLHSVKLQHLSHGVSYCYKVGGDTLLNETNSDSWSNWRSFRTAPNREQPVVLAAFADSGTYGDIIPNMRALAADDEVNIVLHGGDLSYGLNEEKWDVFGDLAEPVASSKPFMVVPGNWDVKPGAINAFVNRFPMPLAYPNPTSTLTKNSETGKLEVTTFRNLFYSFEYTHAYIIMMSSYDPYEKGSLQYEWLRGQLDRANSMRHHLPWLIVVCHSPMYSSSQGHGGSDLKFRGAVEHLFRDANVDLVLSGHDHCYERTFQVYNEKILDSNTQLYASGKGTIHVLAGVAGADQDKWLDRPDWTAHRENSAGYCKIKLTPNLLEFDYTRYNGSIADTFKIFKDNNEKASSHIGIIILIVFLLVLIFPICAYTGLPNKIFNLIMLDPYNSRSLTRRQIV